MARSRRGSFGVGLAARSDVADEDEVASEVLDLRKDGPNVLVREVRHSRGFAPRELMRTFGNTKWPFSRGQAVNFWAHVYEHRVPTVARDAPFTSKDIDFCGDSEVRAHLRGAPER